MVKYIAEGLVAPKKKSSKNPLAGVSCKSDCNYNPLRNNIPLNPDDLTIVEGPFHYQLRASTYGEIYDEIPWRCHFRIQSPRERNAVDRTSLVGSYRNNTLIHNWAEERRDREYIRSAQSPISQYGHLYTTTYHSTIGNKRVCNKEKYALKQIREFPTYMAPVYQPELSPDLIKCCFPKPQECIDREERDACFKEIERQKRVEKASPAPPPPMTYGNDLGKCGNC